MELLLYISVRLVASICVLILFLFLRELGLPKYIYEEITTNPLTKKILTLFGDILYMVGGSIIGAVIYSYLTVSALYITTFIIGILFVALGVFLKKD